MREFWDKDGLYSFLRYYVDFTTRRSYRRITVEGKLPPDNDGVATIYAANHTNTLMDALVVLQLRHGGTLFGARADVFRKPAIAHILHFLKMLPLARHNRDKAEEVAHNRISFEDIDRALAHGLPFCLFPEGRHRPMHSLLPMRRGIATLAFKSASQRPTRIVPIGIDYSDWFHYRGDAVVRIGEPLDVNAFAAGIPADTQDSDRDALLQDEMYGRLSSLIFFLPDDEHYEEALADIRASHPAPARWPRILLAAVTFLFWLVSAVLSAPLWVLAEILCRRMVKDPAFQNTARFGVRLILWPLWALIWLIIGLCTMPLWGALLLLAAYLPSYSLFYDWLNLVRNP
ncbi:MAG: 1-acyl-sn-glycerol-3-phosphate acyltransferase [Bacteroidales bacterium]|nr:1-acyl-sn-glycerol-3-phosphate acyltransferase [Bacteroidales bacterium]